MPVPVPISSEVSVTGNENATNTLVCVFQVAAVADSVNKVEEPPPVLHHQAEEYPALEPVRSQSLCSSTHSSNDMVTEVERQVGTEARFRLHQVVIGIYRNTLVPV